MPWIENPNYVSVVAAKVCHNDQRIARIEKILLSLEWAGVNVEEVSRMGGECVTLDVDRFCLLCGGYSTEPSQYTVPGGGHRGHQSGCLFLELPR